MKARTTKGTAKPKRARTADAGLRRDYSFNYSKSKPNRFARRVRRDAVVIVLDSDVAEVFRESKPVNALLRATIAAVKKRRTRRAG